MCRFQMSIVSDCRSANVHLDVRMQEPAHPFRLCTFAHLHGINISTKAFPYKQDGFIYLYETPWYLFTGDSIFDVIVRHNLCLKCVSTCAW